MALDYDNLRQYETKSLIEFENQVIGSIAREASARREDKRKGKSKGKRKRRR